MNSQNSSAESYNLFLCLHLMDQVNLYEVMLNFFLEKHELLLLEVTHFLRKKDLHYTKYFTQFIANFLMELSFFKFLDFPGN